jgi:hypothetical protein
MLEGLRAEANDDPQTALDLYLETPHVLDAPHERHLRERAPTPLCDSR